MDDNHEQPDAEPVEQGGEPDSRPDDEKPKRGRRDFENQKLFGELKEKTIIIPTEERLVFAAVPSGKSKHRYRVDLSENNGTGGCDCPDFLVRKAGPARSGNGPVGTARCKHILAAREFVVDALVAEEIERSRSGSVSWWDEVKKRILKYL